MTSQIPLEVFSCGFVFFFRIFEPQKLAGFFTNKKTDSFEDETPKETTKKNCEKLSVFS